jgi:hypothetical protein
MAAGCTSKGFFNGLVGGDRAPAIAWTH